MHPDRNPNADQEKFKEITAAYNLLHDEKKRKEYDEYREMNKRFDGSANNQYSQQNNTYNQNYDPFGQNNNNRRYEYRHYSNKDPEEAKKEFEEFIRNSRIFKGGKGAFNNFESFFKNMEDRMNQQRNQYQKRYQDYNSKRNTNRNNNSQQNDNNSDDFFREYFNKYNRYEV